MSRQYGNKRSYRDTGSNRDTHSGSYKKRKVHNEHQYGRTASQQDVAELVDVLPLIKSNKPRKWTVSIALSGSVMNTAKTPQLQAYLASQIARVICIFCVDELVIFSETGKTKPEQPFKPDPNLFLFRLLQYLETPQYLRRLLFPMHDDFRYAGMCRPLRTPHHLGKNEMAPFREGIVLRRSIKHPKQPIKVAVADDADSDKIAKKDKPNIVKNIEKHKSNDNTVSLVSIGLQKDCVIDQKLEENTRVTVQLEGDYMKQTTDAEKYYYGTVVSPNVPMKKQGIYWGFTTRFADDIGHVISESKFKNGYDYVIGTSDKGRDVYSEEFEVPKFKHLLIVFGGPNGLESCVLNETKRKLSKPELLFDDYVNVCPHQGTRTIRSEEAMLMAMSVLQPHIQNNYDLQEK